MSPAKRKPKPEPKRRPGRPKGVPMETVRGLMPADLIAKAYRIGDDCLSRGLRIAVEAYEEKEVKE
jgi:hypothetical protein